MLSLSRVVPARCRPLVEAARGARAGTIAARRSARQRDARAVIAVAFVAESGKDIAPAEAARECHGRDRNQEPRGRRIR